MRYHNAAVMLPQGQWRAPLVAYERRLLMDRGRVAIDLPPIPTTCAPHNCPMGARRQSGAVFAKDAATWKSRPGARIADAIETLLLSVDAIRQIGSTPDISFAILSQNREISA